VRHVHLCVRLLTRPATFEIVATTAFWYENGERCPSGRLRNGATAKWNILPDNLTFLRGMEIRRRLIPRFHRRERLIYCMHNAHSNASIPLFHLNTKGNPARTAWEGCCTLFSALFVILSALYPKPPVGSNFGHASISQKIPNFQNSNRIF
jgi:hypothetical protein